MQYTLPDGSMLDVSAQAWAPGSGSWQHGAGWLAGFPRTPLLQSCTPQVGPARFRAPELLFQPDLVGDESEGLHEVLAFAIHKSDLDLRRTLFANIVLSGGSTLFKGTRVQPETKSSQALRSCIPHPLVPGHGPFSLGFFCAW